MEGLCDSIREVSLVLALVVDEDIELSHLVSVHAGSRHLDRPLPVEVVVAEVESQLLKDVFLDGGVVVGHIEVGRSHTALSGILGDQEEVILSVAILPLNHCGIDQST